MLHMRSNTMANAIFVAHYTRGGNTTQALIKSLIPTVVPYYNTLLFSGHGLYLDNTPYGLPVLFICLYV